MNVTVNPGSDESQDLAAAFSEVAHRRRSTYAYLSEPVPVAVIERALRDAVVAPNHHRTAPWRFCIVMGAGREKLVRAYQAAAARVGFDVARATQRAKDAPVNVIVACVPTVSNPRVLIKEEEFATAAAAQNFMLSLAASGVDSLLTTGDLAESPEVQALVGLGGEPSRVMGVINVGYRNPERRIAARPDPSLSQVTTWITED